MLYIVGTPIGNLEDLSLRQARILSESEIILTEDTRSTGMLLNRISEQFSLHAHPNRRLIAYHKDNEFERLPEVMELLATDKLVSLISQAGMPLMSDPGLLLVKTLIKQSIPFEVIPGPTALTTAAVYSGFDPHSLLFLGFLPKKTSHVRNLLSTIKEIQTKLPGLSVSFYESPHRIQETLGVLAEVMPESNVCICREMTKKFEEIVRGKPAELAKREYKGEITVVIG